MSARTAWRTIRRTASSRLVRIREGGRCFTRRHHGASSRTRPQVCSRAFSLDSPRIVSPDLAATLESLLVHTLRKLAAVRSLFHRLREVRDGDREGHARRLATRKRQVRPVRRFEWTWHAGSKSGDGDDKCVVYTQSLSRVHWAGTSSALHGKTRLSPSFRTAIT